ncbi:unnamed protein product [Thlaspi arvense]|uniref:FBD domain-containing protein n=1 Tax=Thlaspi arvense TaxID=13288 RepID=A0AAU9SEU0_THLAR|nr:unnamed protein product [Thlaspi arvense]
MVPKLKFVSAENVIKSLLLNKAPVLESFHLKTNFGDARDRIETWLAIAFARKLRELLLEVDSEHDDLVTLSSVLFSYNDTLEILVLRSCYIHLEFPTRVRMLCLRKLHLYGVLLNDEASVCNLFGGCPVLEDLVVHQIKNINVGTFTIEVPSLQRLTIYQRKSSSLEGKEKGGYVINAPSLRYLSIEGSGFDGLEFCLIENAPELVEARIKDVSDITNENILESLTSAKHLSLHLSPLEIKYPSGKIFYQLLSLELSTNEKEWWNLLSLMLDASPILQILKLSDTSCSEKDCTVNRKKWNQPNGAPECLLYHLETLVWTRYEWQREDEKEVATYILENARRLKKATFAAKPIESKEFEKAEKRREMLNELASVVKALNSCHLVLE